MAISMKKVCAVTVGSLMLGSAVVSDVFAVEKVGDVNSFVSKIVVDGSPNVNIVVGSNAASNDVVSAANIAAKIGSLMFGEGSSESGSSKLTVTAYSESDDFDLLNDDSSDDSINFTGNGNGLFIACADGDYADALANTAYFDDSTGLDADNGAKSLGKLSTLSKLDDTDPADWFDSDDDAYEFLFVRLTNSSFEWTIHENEMTYATISFTDDTPTFSGLKGLCPGRRIPFLGEEWAIIGMSTDADSVSMGKEVYTGVIKEGESYNLGNGYEVKIDSVIKSIADDEYKVKAQLLKDGKVIKETFDNTPANLCSNGFGIRLFSAWEDVGSENGYVELLICNNMKSLPLGKEFIPDWETYGILKVGSELQYTDDFESGQNKVGIALKYVGDDLEDIDSGDEIDIADYAKILFEETDDDELNVLFEMDDEKEISLGINQNSKVLNAEIKLNEISAEFKESNILNAPIVSLDTEVSLENAEKPLILIGGPVINLLTEKLVDKGISAIDNDSPATLAVVEGAANGNDVLIVSGGDGIATAEAADELINLL